MVLDKLTYYSEEKARDASMYYGEIYEGKVFSKKSQFPDNSAVNSYPCNEGLFAEDLDQGIVVGMAFSHAMLCNIKKKGFELMLTRSLEYNSSKNKGISDEFIVDLTYSSLEMSLSMWKKYDFYKQNVDSFKENTHSQMMIVERNSSKFQENEEQLGRTTDGEMSYVAVKNSFIENLPSQLSLMDSIADPNH